MRQDNFKQKEEVPKKNNLCDTCIYDSLWYKIKFIILGVNKCEKCENYGDESYY